jgi:pimeloyl-ACP methyl ester carboxylesterase
VFTREGVVSELARVRCPTLVMAGEEDVATVPEQSVRIAARIHGAALVSIPRAGHSSAVEHPEAVTAFLSAFLDAQPA